MWPNTMPRIDPTKQNDTAAIAPATDAIANGSVRDGAYATCPAGGPGGGVQPPGG